MAKITGDDAIAALKKLVSADKASAGIVTSGLGNSSDVAGNAIDAGFPHRQRFFTIVGTAVAGGVYTANPFYPSFRGGTSSATTINTAALGTTNTHQTVEVWNVAEIGTSLHFLPVGTATAPQVCWPTAGYDHLQTAGIWYTNVAVLPPILPVKVYQSGGSNGAAVSGALATFNSYTYIYSYNNSTLGTAMIPYAGPRVAGPIIPGTYGNATLNSGTNVYSLRDVLEQVTGPVCS